MPRIDRSIAYVAVTFALLGFVEARAGGTRKVLKAPGFRYRESQHLCTDNDRAAFETGSATVSDLIKFGIPYFVRSKSGAGTDSGAKKTGDGVFKESSVQTKSDPVVEKAQEALKKAAESYSLMQTDIEKQIKEMPDGDQSSNLRLQLEQVQKLATIGKTTSALPPSGSGSGATRGKDDGDEPNPGAGRN